MSSFDISKYKMSLLRDFFSSPGIVSALDSQSDKYAADAPDTLVYVNLFPYLRIPDTQTKADTYIMIAVDSIKPVRGSTLFHDVRITVWVLAHQDRMRMADRSAARIDYLSQEIERLLTGESKYGVGTLELIANQEHILNDKYQYRELIFGTLGLTKTICE